MVLIDGALARGLAFNRDHLIRESFDRPIVKRFGQAIPCNAEREVVDMSHAVISSEVGCSTRVSKYRRQKWYG